MAKGKGLQDLAKKTKRMQAAIEAAASNVAVDVAQSIVGTLAFTTPVDTSNALSNWRATLDAPASDTIGPHFLGSRGSTKKSSATATYEGARPVLAKKKPSQPIYITNNVDYITKLNEDHAQAGFVERAVLLGRKRASKKLKLQGL